MSEKRNWHDNINAVAQIVQAASIALALVVGAYGLLKKNPDEANTTMDKMLKIESENYTDELSQMLDEIRNSPTVPDTTRGNQLVTATKPLRCALDKVSIGVEFGAYDKNIVKEILCRKVWKLDCAMSALGDTALFVNAFDDCMYGTESNSRVKTIFELCNESYDMKQCGGSDRQLQGPMNRH